MLQDNDGKYLLNGIEYTMSIHGLAPYKDFHIRDEREDRVTLELGYDKETYASYPYHFSSQIVFSLDANKLFTEYIVNNNDDRIMYFGLGGHPGFNVPFHGGSFEDYYLHFHKKCNPKTD